MLTRKTVLVLGAGASKPFGFPTGIELSEMVINRLGQPSDDFNALQDICGFEKHQIRSFRDAFLYSGKNSVDAFLEHRTEFLDVGKAATACALIKYEQQQQLFRYEDNWLRYLYNNLNASFDAFCSNTLSFITFNYDRSVEHFLFTSLKNSYGRSDEECVAALQRIPIIHLHGRLGFLPWQDQNGRLYRPELHKDTLKTSIENIKIIHEDISDGRDKDFEQAKLLLAEAEQICFMGFGFNQTNVERLGIRNLPQGRAIATRMGIGQQETAAIAKACDGRIRFVGGDCFNAIREGIVWE